MQGDTAACASLHALTSQGTCRVRFGVESEPLGLLLLPRHARLYPNDLTIAAHVTCWACNAVILKIDVEIILGELTGVRWARNFRHDLTVGVCELPTKGTCPAGRIADDLLYLVAPRLFESSTTSRTFSLS